MYSRGKELVNKIENYKKWKLMALKEFNPENEQHYQYIKPEIFVEEYLGDNLVDYKFFCFHGEVKFFVTDNDRYINLCRSFYDKKINLLPMKHKIFNNKLPLNNCKSVNIPKNIKKMIDIAENLSKKFEFARVDLYNINILEN